MTPKASDEPERFFQVDKADWAETKHQILSRYVRIWLYKLQSRSRVLTIVDGFAGAGVYGDGQKGSPLLLVEFNDDRALTKLGVELHVIAIEADENNLRSLEEALAAWLLPPRRRAVILPGTFEEHCARVATFTRTMPTLFFLDPFGMKELTVEKLAPLLDRGRREPTELLMRVDPTLLARFAGQLHAPEGDARREKLAASFGDLLRRFAMDPSYVDLTNAPDVSREERRATLLQLYAQAFTARFKYVRFLPVKAHHQAAPKYFLMHATDSADGVVKMNDVLSKLSDDQEVSALTAKQLETGQMSMFEAQPVRWVTPRACATRLLESIRASGAAWTPYMHHRAVLVDAFGDELREKDHNRALRELETEGVIEVHRPAKGKLDRAKVRPL